jgi:tRNA modification GTPase
MGGIGIVRISGEGAVACATRIVRLKSGLVGDISHVNAIKYGWVVNAADNAVVDEVMVSFMRAPHTYTREDIVEVNCHGGPAAVGKVLDLCVSAGARLAEPGEFTKRAFLNGRIDLTQAEAVMDVISSAADMSLRLAMDQLSGGLGSRINGIRDSLAELLALTEVSIDFADEEVEYVPPGDLKAMGAVVLADVDRLLDTYEEGRVLRDGLRVAITGRPNVGKSSLLNRLAGMERAIVTEVPGTTRDTVEELISLGGLPVRIVDTAGIRQSDDIVEAEGIKRAEAALDVSDLALLVIDGSRPLEPEDHELIGRVKEKKFIPVINKSDLPAGVGEGAYSELFLPAAPVFISAKEGAGLDALTVRIREAALGGPSERPPEAAINLRHRESLKKAQAALVRFGDGCGEGLSPELLALELREALDAVGDVVGETTPDEVLNMIFSRFCIGK